MTDGVGSTTNIYIHSLPLEVTDEHLTRIFSSFGDIESARVMVDFTTQTSKGYGFVNFKTPESAANAIQAMNGHKLKDKTLVVKPAFESTETAGSTPNTNIYVKGLPITVTAEHLKSVFTQYGEVTECRILIDAETQISRGLALVRFSEVVGATAAVNTADGVPFPAPGNVKPLSVKFADTDEEKALRRAKSRKRLAVQSRFVPYGAPNSPSPLMTSSGHIYPPQFYPSPLALSVDSIMAPYNPSPAHQYHHPAPPRSPGSPHHQPPQHGGGGGNYSAPTSYPPPPPGFPSPPSHYQPHHQQQQQHGGSNMYNTPSSPQYSPPYNQQGGANAYSPPQHSAQRLSQSAGIAPPGIGGNHPSSSYRAPSYPSSVGGYPHQYPGSPSYQGPTSYPSPSYASSSLRLSSSGGVPMQGVTSDSDPNVYIYHLPPDADDALLYSRFGRYGPIRSLKIGRDPATGQCKGFGFVRFQSMDAALAAINSENGQRLNGKALSVSLASKKASQG